MTGAELITEERKRQVVIEGWTEKHDDIQNEDGALALAAACYTTHAYSLLGKYRAFYSNWAVTHWPWDDHYWKPTRQDPVRELVKAGALIAAEIDRLQRKEEAAK